MGKAKNNDELASDIITLTEEDYNKIKEQDKVVVIIKSGGHTKHLQEGSEHELNGELAVELLKAKKAILK